MPVTCLAEVSAIVNSRPLVPLTSDPDDPTPLTPSLLLTQKPQQVTGIRRYQIAKTCILSKGKMCKCLHKCFGSDDNHSTCKLFKVDRNVVLIRDKQTARNSWPLGIIEIIHSGSDNCDRTCEVRITRNGERFVLYTRPVTELVLLIPDNCYLCLI